MRRSRAIVLVAVVATGCGTRSSETRTTDAAAETIEVDAVATVDGGPRRVDAGPPGWDAETPLPEDQYVERHAAELCAAWSGCCGAIGVAINEDVCRASVAANAREAVAFRKEQGGVYDPVAAGHCVAAVRAATALCTIDRLDPAMTEVDKWCEKVIPGMGNEGDPCHGPGDCKEQPGQIALCRREGSGSFCWYQTRSEVGEPCGLAKGRQCGEFAYCDGEVCRPIRRAGESCVSPDDAQCSTDRCLDDRCQHIQLFTTESCGGPR